MLRGLGAFFVALFLMVSVSTLIFSMSGNTLLDAETYQDALMQSNSYVFIEEKLQSDKELPLAEGIKPTVDRLFDNGLAYVRGDTDELDLTVKLDTTKLRAFFEERARNFTVCETDELPYDEDDEPQCRPPDRDPIEFMDEMLEKKNFTFEDEVNLATLWDEHGTFFSGAREGVHMFKVGQVATIVCVVLLIFLIRLLTRPSVKSMLRIVGICFMLPGMFWVSLSYTLKNIGMNYVQQGIPFSPDFIKILAVTVFNALALYGGIATVVGIVMIVYSFKR